MEEEVRSDSPSPTGAPAAPPTVGSCKAPRLSARRHLIDASSRPSRWSPRRRLHHCLVLDLLAAEQKRVRRSCSSPLGCGRHRMGERWRRPVLTSATGERGRVRGGVGEGRSREETTKTEGLRLAGGGAPHRAGGGAPHLAGGGAPCGGSRGKGTPRRWRRERRGRVGGERKYTGGSGNGIKKISESGCWDEGKI